MHRPRNHRNHGDSLLNPNCRDAAWMPAQVGQVTCLFRGHDAGFRGHDAGQILAPSRETQSLRRGARLNPISHAPPEKPLSYIIPLCSKLADEPHRPHPRARRGPRPHRRTHPRARRTRPRSRRLRLGPSAEKAPQGRLVARPATRLYRGARRLRFGRQCRARRRHVRILRLSPAPFPGSRSVRPRLGCGDR